MLVVSTSPTLPPPTPRATKIHGQAKIFGSGMERGGKALVYWPMWPAYAEASIIASASEGSDSLIL